ncbi:hypothetical protein BOX15_Mlig014819g2 [Macrostomum lignano]|uniref:Tyrosine specific protein phosphatases domain-containing protein n=1 Tax=Macrostomum lignano TaxID=282301 RepID=A0A267FQJ0_9PLAT|nr:hypothetical protein BOX15_Mlig014819g2 [Macrostomum lignano]
MENGQPSDIRLVASNAQNQRLRLYRGLALNKLKPAEVAKVIGDGEQQLRSVLDIRTKEEIGDCIDYPVPEGVSYRILQLDSRSGEFVELRSAKAASESDSAVITFYRVDFYTLTKKLKIFSGLLWNNWRLALSGWTSSERFDTTDGIKMGILKKLASDVAHSKGGAGLYLDWLDPAMDCSGLVALFRLLCNPDIYPAMLHCQYGKDRTGAVCALLQMMDPGMTEDQVVDEYHATEVHIKRLLPEIEAKVKRAGMPDECARCPKELIKEVLDWIKNRYGTVEDYLLQIGLQEAEVVAIKSNLGYVKG